jgi:hypothetical protein
VLSSYLTLSVSLSVPTMVGVGQGGYIDDPGTWRLKIQIKIWLQSTLKASTLEFKFFFYMLYVSVGLDEIYLAMASLACES